MFIQEVVHEGHRKNRQRRRRLVRRITRHESGTLVRRECQRLSDEILHLRNEVRQLEQQGAQVRNLPFKIGFLLCFLLS